MVEPNRRHASDEGLMNTSRVWLFVTVAEGVNIMCEYFPEIIAIAQWNNQTEDIG